jgi:SAM-dependent methyltransferase
MYSRRGSNQHHSVAAKGWRGTGPVGVPVQAFSGPYGGEFWMAQVCRVCGGDASAAACHVVPEMMFGTREQFEYFECPACGCLQISEVPADLSAFYPAGYYSYQIEPWWKVWLKGRRLRHGIGRFSMVGAQMSRLYGPDACARAVHLGNVAEDEAILDVGGGNGAHLRPLRAAGFRSLLCVDPFVKQEVTEPGLKVRRLRIQDVTGKFRLIMMHHSFEHMPDQRDVLRAAFGLLADDGLLLVRIPVLGYGWRTYGVDWVELDAPRHLFLHTRASFEQLASRHGLEIIDVVFDSTELEIWGSEQYRRGVALMAPESYGINPAASLFSTKDIAGFRNRIAGLNKTGESGRAAFILRRSAPTGSDGIRG